MLWICVHRRWCSSWRLSQMYGILSQHSPSIECSLTAVMADSCNYWSWNHQSKYQRGRVKIITWVLLCSCEWCHAVCPGLYAHAVLSFHPQLSLTSLSCLCIYTSRCLWVTSSIWSTIWLRLTHVCLPVCLFKSISWVFCVGSQVGLSQTQLFAASTILEQSGSCCWFCLRCCIG